VLRVYAASGRRHQPIRLRYRVHDNDGRTSERVRIYRGKKLLKTFIRPVRTTDAAVAYWVTYSFPARAAYRFCVRATDAARNASPLHCAAIRIS
jgi:hypothetical protein